MASLILVIGIVVLIVSVALYQTFDNEVFTVTGVVSGIIAFIAFFVFVGSTICVCDATTAEDRITILTEQNTEIEHQVDLAVAKYMEHEKTTFKDLKGKSSITLVSLYPELKSDELIKKQIEVYVNNNNAIKDLKLTKAEAKIWRWWLYFGWE